MIYPSPWKHTLTVDRHHYYEMKPQFEREQDVYESWAAFAVTNGSFAYRIGKSEGTAAADQLVICPPHTVFFRHTDRPISFHYFLFHWMLQDSGMPIRSDSHSGIVLSFQRTDRVHSSLLSLRSPDFSIHPMYAQWCSHALLDLFRLHAMERDAPAAASASTDPLMEEARQILDTACDKPLTIGTVAAGLGMNSVQFSRRFRRVYGMKPSTYIEKLKLDKVCYLLTHTRMTLEQVAQACGFNNAFYLSRYFSQKLNMPPSEYRSQYRV